MQGEQGVHSDHSLSRTEKRMRGMKQEQNMMGYLKQKVLTQLPKRRCVTFTLSRVTLQRPIVAKAASQADKETTLTACDLTLMTTISVVVVENQQVTSYCSQWRPRPPGGL